MHALVARRFWCCASTKSILSKPKVLLPQFINQSINLVAFQSASQSDQAGDHLLCSVRALRHYLAATIRLRHTDQLFVCYGCARKGAAVSKQRLLNWIVEVITMAYKKAQKPLPEGISCHSTMAVSTSWATFMMGLHGGFYLSSFILATSSNNLNALLSIKMPHHRTVIFWTDLCACLSTENTNNI